mgnify:CR=1 FL=1
MAWWLSLITLPYRIDSLPLHTDYVLEGGASRNYEPWRDEEATKAEAVKAREEEEMGNAMKVRRARSGGG